MDIQAKQLKSKMLALNSNYYELGSEVNMAGNDVHDVLSGVKPLDYAMASKLEKGLELLYWRAKNRIEKAFGKPLN